MVSRCPKSEEMSKNCFTKNSNICYQKQHMRKTEISKLRDPGGKQTSPMRRRQLFRSCGFRRNAKWGRYGGVLNKEILLLKKAQVF